MIVEVGVKSSGDLEAAAVVDLAWILVVYQIPTVYFVSSKKL